MEKYHNDHLSKNVALEIDGKVFLLNQMNGWVTMSQYVKMFNLKGVNVINNWIMRRIVPPENVIEIPELNNLRLVKAIMYNAKATGRPSARK